MSSTGADTTEAEAAAVPGLADVCQKAYDGKIRDNVTTYNDHFTKAGKREEDYDYEARTEKTVELAQSYYTLVTDFYEYGYGASFHFGPVKDGQSLEDCLRDYEQEIARTLEAKPGMKILVSVWGRCLLINIPFGFLSIASFYIPTLSIIHSHYYCQMF